VTYPIPLGRGRSISLEALRSSHSGQGDPKRMFEVRTLDWHHLYDMGEFDREQNYHRIQNGVGYALIKDGRVLWVGGAIRLWPGVAKAWTLTREDNNKLTQRRIFHGVRIIFNAINKRYDRVEADTDASGTGGAWLDKLGFKAESEMRKYWQGKTFVRYGLVN